MASNDFNLPYGSVAVAAWQAPHIRPPPRTPLLSEIRAKPLLVNFLFPEPAPCENAREDSGWGGRGEIIQGGEDRVNAVRGDSM